LINLSSDLSIETIDSQKTIADSIDIAKILSTIGTANSMINPY